MSVSGGFSTTRTCSTGKAPERTPEAAPFLTFDHLAQPGQPFAFSWRTGVTLALHRRVIPLHPPQEPSTLDC